MVVKVSEDAAVKDPQTSGFAQNLKIVTFIRKENEEKDRK